MEKSGRKWVPLTKRKTLPTTIHPVVGVALFGSVLSGLLSSSSEQLCVPVIARYFHYLAYLAQVYVAHIKAA